MEGLFGPILNKQGKILGRSKGIPFYSIGQRKGLGISNGERLYVTAIDPERNTIQITPVKSAAISFKSLAERLKRLGEVRFNNFMLVFKERDKEISLFKDGRVIIKGTDDEKVARSLYARYVGI